MTRGKSGNGDGVTVSASDVGAMPPEIAEDPPPSPAHAEFAPHVATTPKVGGKVFARLLDNIVVEIVREVDNIANEWPAAFLAMCVDITSISPQPEGGWTYNGTTFSAPAPYVPSPQSQMNDALAAGLAITSTGTSAINGTYDGVGPRLAHMLQVAQYIGAAGQFPLGLSTFEWVAKTGTVTFPTTASFIAVAVKIGDWVTHWQRFVDGFEGSAPANEVTIA